MAIHPQLQGVVRAGGSIELSCKECKADAIDATTMNDHKPLKVCSKCGAALGEWETEVERDAELKEFTGKLYAAAKRNDGD